MRARAGLRDHFDVLCQCGGFRGFGNRGQSEPGGDGAFMGATVGQ